MTCEELKNKIINKTVDDSFLVCVYNKDNTKFIIEQYIDQISKDRQLIKKYVDSIEEIALDANQLFSTAENILYVVYTDKLVCTEQLKNYTNTIVVCKSAVNEDSCKDNVVTFPVLTKDQIYEYMEVCCPGIPENKLHWLYDITGGDIYRIAVELKKLSIFATTSQEAVMNQLVKEDGYLDLNQITVYNCINAFMFKNKKALLDIVQKLDSINIDSIWLTNAFLSTIKNVIQVQLYTGPITDEVLNGWGLTKAQYDSVNKKCDKFSVRQLADMFEFLTDIDYRLKSGLLDMNNNQMVSYILTSLMEVGYGKA